MHQRIFSVLVFICGFIILFFLPRKIKLSMSDLIAFDLYNLYANVDKFNGKNPHFKEEAEKALRDLEYNIEQYLNERKTHSLSDFNEPKNTEYIKRLKESSKKLICFFEEYNKYKEKKQTLLLILSWYVLLMRQKRLIC